MLQAGDGAISGSSSRKISAAMSLAAHGRDPAVSSAAHTAPTSKDSRPIYRCEDVEVDPSRGCLTRGGLEHHLRQQSFHLLLYMIERRQRLISKEELIENFWQGAAVTDNAVVQCIKEVRKALGDDPHEPRFIRTIHKLGYRFIAEVAEEPVPAGAPHKIPELEGGNTPRAGAEAPPGEIPPVKGRLTVLTPRLRWLMAGLLATAAGVFGWTLIRHSAAPRLEVTLPRVPG